MTVYRDEVGADIRAASAWDADYAAYRAPDGRYWRFMGPIPGMEVRDARGYCVTIAKWLRSEKVVPCS